MLGIKDIAQECNVSLTTVSRALNNNKGISEKTRDYILAVCEKRGYRPNSAARSLILKKTNMIGLIIPDITNQYYAYISKGVSAFLEKVGYGLILCNSDRNKANEKMYTQFLSEKRVDGIILIPIKPKKDDYSFLLNHDIPLVLIDNYVNDLDVSFITNDNYAGARKIVTHMIKQGYRRIGVILGDENSSASNGRLTGYLDVLREHGMDIDKGILVYSDARFEDGFNLAPKLIEQNVDAIFAINDVVALGVLKYCYLKGIRIPEDIGVAGYDDIEQGSMLPIPLTTVHQRKHTLGAKAAEILIHEINNPQFGKQKVILQPEIVIRKSCGE
ncbi:LacI family DNA-binding transcriptional regulator [Sporomusa sp.]|uniref:LacI family DNA-binding transcriptional regulator n=1 Tax=Sporomusa sp. TaxID=2078658 RepID=UPI002D13D802|nr:LacI family DNA-binding transcriptional regulator [Sporomusa sp.]HWR41916.1 LacI family DNA-binding transcriptional regulator [Sporomusa sp.]